MNILIKYFPVIPAVFLLIAVISLLNILKKKSNYRKTTGTIVDFHEETSEARISDASAKVRMPIVSYTVNGIAYRFKANYYSYSMETGNTVEVLYEQANPENAMLKNGMFVFPVLTGGLSLLTTAGYIVLILLKFIGFI
ncbi:MAG: DUF3592 domain-containing protein [Clostridia bacterium]|nr:DUF3592 domain-containing protein [Clostridia bacterium]